MPLPKLLDLDIDLPLSWARYGKLLTPDEVKKRLGVSLATLSAWRSTGSGPRYLKLGARVMYREQAVDDWIRDREFSNSADWRAAQK